MQPVNHAPTLSRPRAKTTPFPLSPAMTFKHCPLMARIRAILFDKDGTLLDFQATWGVWAVGYVDCLADGDQTSGRAASQRQSPSTVRCSPVPPRKRRDSREVPIDIALALHPVLTDPPPVPELALDVARASESAIPQEAVPLRPFFTDLRAAGHPGLPSSPTTAKTLPTPTSARSASRAFVNFVAGYDSGLRRQTWPRTAPRGV